MRKDQPTSMGLPVNTQTIYILSGDSSDMYKDTLKAPSKAVLAVDQFFLVNVLTAFPWLS